DRYHELAIFAEDTEIDLATLSVLWGSTGGLTPRAARRLVANLHEQSLVTDYRPETGSVRLHDVVRAYLREGFGEDRVVPTNRARPAAAARHFSVGDHDERLWWDLPPSASYLWRHLCSHLLGADRRDELETLLTDLRWFAAKIRHVGVAAIDADLSI